MLKVSTEPEYLFSLLKFDPERFEDNWRAALEAIRDDKHTFRCFLSDGEYQWKTIMLFDEFSDAFE